ncbi:MAG: ATP-binding protein [bacterium]|nr:ATP-binding protein [bacterium]
MAKKGSRTCQSFTSARRRPTELGRIPGLTLPWTFTLPQVAVFMAALMVGLFLVRLGMTAWVLVPLLGGAAAVGRALRRVSVDGRGFAAGAGGKVRFWMHRQSHKELTNRSADLVAGNVAVGDDHSVWLLFSVEPANYGLLADTAEGLRSLGAVEQLVLAVGGERWRLLSTVEQLSAGTVADRMRRASQATSWEAEIAAETARIRSAELTERRFWLWVQAGHVPMGSNLVGWWHRALRTFGYTRAARADAIGWERLAARTEQVVSRAAGSVPLRAATLDEVTALLERVPFGATTPREPTEPDDYPHLMLPQSRPDALTVGRGMVEGASAWHRGAAEWCEPTSGVVLAATRHGTVAHTTAALSEIPSTWTVPGGGEVLWALDALEDPWDWLVDVTVTPHAVAAARARNLDRQLAGQWSQHDGDPAGAPPELRLAVEQVAGQREALAARTDSDEYNICVLFSTAVRVVGDDVAAAVGTLRSRMHRLEARAAAVGMSVAVPSGDQIAARGVWLPRVSSARYLHDYMQVVLSDGLAGLGPLLQSRLGDPQGALLGVHDERGWLEPILFDPTLGPRARSVGAEPQSPSIGVVGSLGSGKSVFLKRCLWTTLAAGGQCVVVDRSERDVGEYVSFAEVVGQVTDLKVEVIDVTEGSVSLDPLRTLSDRRAAAEVAVRLLSHVLDLDARSTVATQLGRAAARCHGQSLLELMDKAADGDETTPPAVWSEHRNLIAHLAENTVAGALFDPRRRPADLSADLVVLHAPGLALADTTDTAADIAAAAVVLGTLLVGHAATFAHPRFAALLLDEAWSLVRDPKAQASVVEALRDGRKHNTGVWIGTQSANDFASTELRELLGQVAVFRSRNPEAATAAAALAGADPDIAAPLLTDLPTGTMLWRDIYGRLGVVDVLLPADPRAAAAIDTTPAPALVTQR